ncbi:hypothetical protein GCM10027589_29670 [Actinocorallia lasiicapitis]
MRRFWVLALLIPLAACSSGTEKMPADAPFTPSSRPHASGAVWKLPQAPVESRIGHVAVWSGREMIVWGGIGDGDRDRNVRGEEWVYGRPLVDGAAYDPATETWRKIATGPLTARTGAVAVMTATTVFVWGGQTPAGRGPALSDGAEYDPVGDSWKPLPPAPVALRSGPAVVWTGTEVLLWGGLGGHDDWQEDGAAYAPATRTWRKLSAAPLRFDYEAQTVWTGREMIAIADDPGHTAAAFDPAANTWRRLPALGKGYQGFGHRDPVWISDRVVSQSRIPEEYPSRSLDPTTARWTDLAVPDRPKNSSLEGMSFATPKGILTWNGSQPAVLYTPSPAAWRQIAVPDRLPYRERASLVWTGTDLIVFGGDTCGPAARCVALRTAHDALSLRP